MTFNGFTQHDFQTFAIDGLEERMQAIQERIQPKFKELGGTLAADLSVLIGHEMHLHIAKHARRTVNPPKDTWLALCYDKRGYKKHPHFQIGLFDDHLFLWLAYIYELPHKQEIAKRFLDNLDTVAKTIPQDYVISLDHMQKGATPVQELSKEQLKETLVRFRDVKKAEFLIGRHVPANDPLLQDGDAFTQFAKKTFEELLPLYHLSLTR